jgi:YD repeat-containing protein
VLSCDKEEPGFSGDTALLKEVCFDLEKMYVYTYTSDNQLYEEKSKWHYTKYNYNRGSLVASDHYLDQRVFSSSSTLSDSAFNRTDWVNPDNTEKYSTTFYEYENGKLVRTLNNLGFSTYSYDDNDRISRRTYYHNEEISGYHDYLYDKIGNLTEELHYIVAKSGGAELQTTTEYEFDNKHNPYRTFSSLMVPGLHTNINNIIKKTYTIHFEVDSSIEKVQVTENVYEYNEAGYPVLKNGNVEYRYY